MKISIEYQSQKFQEFLQEENNSNIIFSGIYGIGKSYFINDFFNKRHTNEYIPIILTPVNYSVANNEDIFEYIKADILLQLLEKVPCDFSNIQITSSVATYYYINNNLDNIIGNILSTAEKVCFKTDIIHQLLELKKSIEKFQKENSLSEDAEVKSFMIELSQKQGSIYESNIITQIIQKLISNAKDEGENNKEAVLIIDDLDRIDPEHIFRILNILSAHDDFCRTNEHKFKFDKTILVCDIENIRKIFHAKYGADVDFSGYIDKFYSKEIFHFDNEYEIAKCIVEQVKKIKSDSDLIQEHKYSFTNLIYILEHLIKYHLINIRTLEKFEFNYYFGNKYFEYNKMKYWVANAPSLFIFEFLQRIFGAPVLLQSALLKLTKKTVNHKVNHILDSFIILADLPNNNLQAPNSPFVTVHTYKGIEYNIGEFDNMLIANVKQDYKSLPFNIFEVLYDAYINYQTYMPK